MRVRGEISAQARRDHEGSPEIVVRLEHALGCTEAQCTEQGAEASAPNRQMIVSGKGPNAGPQIFPFEL